MSAKTEIRRADVPADVDAARALFREYAASLDVDLGYQGFEAELAGLPGKYAPPKGALFIARSTGQAIGCVALRALDNPGICEMKRLYITPAGRGTGLGRALAEAILAEARTLGYREMWLDALPSFKAAIALYKSAGFEEMAPYYATPVAGTVFLRRRL
ncbi:MAG TPA: GNAT family N-acetyltransferase [Hyphomicrobiaceae bacterium]|nr:GNAT family N-acetyltransferase [Hyphomicrobiaceae bacterium]